MSPTGSRYLNAFVNHSSHDLVCMCLYLCDDDENMRTNTHAIEKEKSFLRITVIVK